MSFDFQKYQATIDELQKANKHFNQIYPGEPSGRQPVHTVYGGAHLF